MIKIIITFIISLLFVENGFSCRIVLPSTKEDMQKIKLPMLKEIKSNQSLKKLGLSITLENITNPKLVDSYKPVGKGDCSDLPYLFFLSSFLIERDKCKYFGSLTKGYSNDKVTVHWNKKCVKK